MGQLEFVPKYYEDKLRPRIINPCGYVGVVTQWSRLDGDNGFIRRISEGGSQLLDPNRSPIVAITNLYGNGLARMLANLAYNPQVERVAVTGVASTDSGLALFNFFEKGVEEKSVGGVDVVHIPETTFDIDAGLRPEVFRYRPHVRQFDREDLGGLVKYITQEPSGRDYSEDDRVNIDIKEPKFRDYPSDITNHNIREETPLKAWMELMFLLDRFGVNVALKKGSRRALFNLDVTVLNPGFEEDDKIRECGFDPDKLRRYREEMLEGELGPDNPSYTYGNRLRKYWGVDSLESVIKRLKEDNSDRHCLISLWDPKKDIYEMGDSAAPCLTDLYFVQNPNDQRLMLTATFRTHNAVSAWLENLYGLRSIQEYVANAVGMGPGQINVRSRWIGIDPENAKTQAALGVVNEHRRKPLVVEDPIGYFVVNVTGGGLVLEHYGASNLKLGEYKGENARKIKDSLRKDVALLDPDHAMWIGHQLAWAEAKLRGLVEEIPDV